MSKHEKEGGKQLREKFNLRAKPGQVIPYSQADDELRDRMKNVMEPIKQAPDSFEALITYGHRPLAKLGRVAKRMLSVQEKFNAAVNRVAKALDVSPSDTETQAIGQSVEERIVDAMMDDKSDLTEEEQDDLIDQLHTKMVKDIQKSVEALQTADQDIEQLLDESRRVQRQRRDATREIGVHLGASERLSEKFEGKFLKKAVKKFSKSWDAEGKQVLKGILAGSEDLADRVAILEGSRNASLIAREQLSQMRETMQDQRAKIAEILNEVKNEWKPMFESTGINPFAPKP